MNDEPNDKAEKPKKPEPRRTGQVIARGKGKWLIRLFLGRDSEGRRHYSLYDAYEYGTEHPKPAATERKP
jgi:hypothetical protein